MNLLRLLTNNLPLKIFSLVIALAIYLYASLERVYSNTVPVPIAFRNLDTSRVISNVGTNYAQVGVEAKGIDLLRLRFAKPILSLDLSRVKLGTTRFSLREGELKLLPRLAVKGITPDTLEVVVDELGRRRVNLSIPLKGRPQRGFALSTVVVKDTVYLQGPKDAVALIANLTAEPCELQNLNRTTERRLKVIIPAGRGFVSRPESVNIRIEIEPEAKRTFFGLKLHIEQEPKIRATVGPTRVNIEVSGPESRINRLKPEEIQATLRLKGLKKGSYELPCEILLPEGISLSRCDPTRFRVEVY